LKIIGNWGGPVQQPGMVGFGFLVNIMPSFLQVAVYQNRYLLRDGHHRAYGFLQRGISVVPAFVREFSQFEHLGLPPGMLPQSAYMNERPPMLVDFMDDTVSADVVLPAFQKMIVIQGLELTPRRTS
jgi:hypothetical protein